eukprot:6161926-Prymnesium_polylepis.2
MCVTAHKGHGERTRKSPESIKYFGQVSKKLPKGQPFRVSSFSCIIATGKPSSRAARNSLASASPVVSTTPVVSTNVSLLRFVHGEGRGE